MKRKPQVLSIERLEKLSTQRLLAYLKQLHKCEESFDLSDCDVNLDSNNPNFIQFKNTDKWKLAYKQVKLILDGREHIQN
jgi:hypothetical protein